MQMSMSIYDSEQHGTYFFAIAAVFVARGCCIAVVP